jgi:hypothetical protein
MFAIAWPQSARCAPGGDEAQPDIVGSERAKVTVAFVPSTFREVVREAATTRSTAEEAIRANPDVARRASASSTRSGCAQKEPRFQSSVSRELRIVSISAEPPSHFAMRSGGGKIARSRSRTSCSYSAMSHILPLMRASYEV